MESIKSAIYVIMIRPATAFFLSLVTLIYCLVEGLNPFSKLIIKFLSSGDGDVAKSTFVLISIIMDLETSLVKIVLVLAMSAGLSLLTAFILSGYFYVLTNIVNRKEKILGEFFTGVKAYFGKMYFASFATILSAFLFIFFLLVAIVPGISMTMAQGGSAQDLAVTFLIDIVTIVVVFLAFMFWSVYIFFWYPAIFFSGGNAFKKSKIIIEKHFWDAFSKILLFDIAIVVYQVIYSNIYTFMGNGNIVLFMINWMVKTIMFVSFVTYLFRAYKFYNESSTQTVEGANQQANFDQDYSEEQYRKPRVAYNQDEDDDYSRRYERARAIKGKESYLSQEDDHSEEQGNLEDEEELRKQYLKSRLRQTDQAPDYRRKFADTEHTQDLSERGQNIRPRTDDRDRNIRQGSDDRDRNGRPRADDIDRKTRPSVEDTNRVARPRVEGRDQNIRPRVDDRGQGEGRGNRQQGIETNQNKKKDRLDENKGYRNYFEEYDDYEEER